MESIHGASQETVSYDSCAHLKAVADDLKNCYHILVAYYVTCIAEKTPKRKAVDVVCHICKLKKRKKNKRIHVCQFRVCNGKKNKRIHACLECAFFGCFDLCEFGKENGAISHMEGHSVENKHYFAININHGCVFCFRCNDYIYNKTFEEILNSYEVEARKINGSPCYLPYKPKEEEISQLRGKIIKISDKTFFPLRGIVNIGNKCYVNCIIQIFLHNPIMVDFFLSDKHNCWKKYSDSCLICEMFILFQEFYKGFTIPYDPSIFFIKLQKLGTETEGVCLLKDILTDSPQDACQIFEEIVTGLLVSCQQTHETLHCNCFIHKTFYGIHRMSRKCLCGVESTSFDHFTSIPLSIEENNNSLAEILNKKYLESEMLNDYTCLNCNQKKVSSELTIEKLPAVICFLINWYNFEKTKNSKYKKTEVKSSFAFKESIDMSDYLYSKDKTSDKSQHISKNRYYLFGAIVYIPDEKRDSGHYISYIKLKRDLWFEIDSALIYERNLEHVLACKPLLLFYYKQI